MRFVVLVPVALALVVLLAPAALGHAQAHDSFPARGARIASAPDHVSITFTESVDESTTHFALVNATLVPYELGPLTFSDNSHRVRAFILDTIPNGGYVLKWETISAVDGHKTRGGIPFGVGGGVPPAGESALEDVGLRADAVVGKALRFIGLSLASGAFAFWYLVLPRGQRKGLEPVVERVGLAAAWMQLGGILLFAYSQYDISDLTFREYFFDTVFGQGVVVGLVLAALLVVGFTYAWRAPDVPAVVWAAIAVIVVLSFVNYGRFSHTAAFLLPEWVGASVDALHLAAVGTWTGALVLFLAFLHSLPRDQAELAEHLRRVPARFSNLATIAVVIAGATGVFMVWAIVGFGIQDWIDTDYGFLLALKIVLALVMIGLGGLNKVVYVVKYAKTGGVATLRAFRANVTREVFLGVGVFLLAAMITNISPTYQAGQGPGGGDLPGVDELDPIVVDTANYVWTFQYHPPPALGEETHYMTDLVVNETQTRETSAASVRMVFENRDQPDLGTTEVRATRTVTGTYEVVGAFFTVPGRWAITYEITTDIAFREQAKVEFEL